MPTPIIMSEKNYTEKPDTKLFKMHTHDMYEIYCFISGKAKYFIEGTIYNLKPKDILVIKKSEAHTLLITSEAPYERIFLLFNAEALFNEDREETLSFLDKKVFGQNNDFPFEIYSYKNWIYYLEKICSSSDINEKRSYLTVLVKELSIAYKEKSGKSIPTDKTNLIIQYINEKLTSDINPESISKAFNYSITHLNRKFKQMVGSTVHEYILTKRLFYAKELIKSGVPPTSACVISGFSDYSTFFRNYKARFGVSPKKDFT